MSSSLPVTPSQLHLGRRLVESGRITSEQLAACLTEVEARAGHASLGDVLVGRGLLDPAELSRVLTRLLDESAPASGGAPSPVPAGAAAPPTTARRLARYELLEEIGRGGMGVVYRGRDPALDREVAIKVLGVGGPAPSPTQVRRFEREARAAGRLRHPGIVAVHEVGVSGEGEAAGRPFLVMDLVRGESLEALLRRHAAPPRRLAEVVRDVALALQHAHDHGIVHRDVKPENVLVETERDGAGGVWDRRPRVYLTDFGLAREVSAEDERLTVSGQLVGTPAYMAPEQVGQGRFPVGPTTDVHALGAVLYRGLAGRPPFGGEELMATLRAVIADDPPPPSRLGAAVHPDLETIAMRCLEKEPPRRYPSARALAEELGRFCDGEPIHARPAGRVARVRRWARRNRLTAAAVGVAALVLVGAAAFGIVVLAEMRRRVDQERARIRARAAREAQEAIAAFGDARRAVAADGERASDRLDRLLAQGLVAVEAAAAWRAIASDDPGARDGAFDALTAYGEVALDAEQWAVAASAFDRARALGVDDAAARRMADRVERERRAVAERHRVEVERLLDAARTGELQARPDGHEDAVFALVRYPEAQTVRLLADALDEVGSVLEAALREVHLAALEPTEAEAARGEGRIEGLEAAFERWLHAQTDVPSDVMDVIARARRRIEERLASQRAASAIAIIATEQTRRLGPERIALARLCIAALGRIGIREGAVEALGRYLRVEMDELRALEAGIALCQLGGERAERLLVSTVINRHAEGGIFWSRVQRHLGRLGAETPLREESYAGYLERATLRRAKGELVSALADCASALEHDPEGAQAWSVSGLIKKDLGDPEGALADLSRAVELAPEDLGLRVNRAIMRHELGDLAGALEDASRAVQIDPRSATAHDTRGNARYARGELAAAIADYTRAIELDPAEPAPWNNRGMARIDAGDLAGATEDFERAVQRDERFALAWSNLAMARMRAGRYPEAIADASRAIELEPEMAPAWYNRAQAREERGDVEGAIADMTRAIDLVPDRALTWFQRARLQTRADRVDQALADLGRALELDPSLGVAWQLRGYIRDQRGDREGALSDLRMSLEAGLDPPHAEASRAKIRKIEQGR